MRPSKTPREGRPNRRPFGQLSHLAVVETSRKEVTPAPVQHASDAYEAIRAINLTLEVATPAPIAYDILGNLQGAAGLMPQALNQIACGLANSLGQYDVYQTDGTEPIDNVAAATNYLELATTKAAELASLLEKAQTAIKHQTIRTARQ